MMSTASEQLLELVARWQDVALELAEAVEARDFRRMRLCWRQGQRLFKLLQPLLGEAQSSQAQQSGVPAALLQAANCWQAAGTNLGQWRSAVGDELHELRERNKRGRQLKLRYGYQGVVVGRNVRINVRIRRP